jgi:homoserine O-acetyltransferase
MGEAFRSRTRHRRRADDRFRIEFSVESYMENHANKFSGTFDANCYLYLSRASDLFSLAEHGGSLEAGFRRLKLQRALVTTLTWWNWTASRATTPSSWTWMHSGR